jgi:hypothetical protein
LLGIAELALGFRGRQNASIIEVENVMCSWGNLDVDPADLQ